MYKALSPSQPLVRSYVTDSPVLTSRFPGAVGLHGGPPVIAVPADMSSTGQPYYLGIMHYKQTKKDGVLYYPHYLYTPQPHAPFQITQVAYRPLPLQLEATPDEWKRRIAYVSGQWLDVSNGWLYISYGSADKTARLMSMPAEVIDTFFKPMHRRARDTKEVAQWT